MRATRADETTTSAETHPVWPAPAHPAPAPGEETLLETTLTIGTHNGFAVWIAGFGTLAGETFGAIDKTAFEDAGEQRELTVFAVNTIG